MHERPIISVVVATWCPGAGLDRVIASLDAQTLPQDEFETIFVDDGSPDDTVDRLRALAASRPNMRVERIERSGWPSRPRNTGIAMARGRWVFFMDHDDSLYPDALRRMAEYATETGAELLSPKESKTTDPWWGVSALARGDVPDAARTGGIGQLLPMVPHKLYSLDLLRRCGITFPEGSRRLWEDISFNVQAWASAERVALLADTPVYLWHSSGSNSSKTYGPRTEEYWDRLDELCAAIDLALAGPEHEADRRSALLHQYRSRVLSRLSQDLAASTQKERTRAMRRAAAIQSQYIDEAWDRRLSPVPMARALLLRLGRADLLEQLWAADHDVAVAVRASHVEWVDGRLRIEVTGGWRHRDGRPLVLTGAGSGAIRDLPPALLAVLPPEAVDFGDSLRACTLDIAVRERDEHVTWPVRVEQRVEWSEVEGGRTPLVTATAFVDPADRGHGSALPATALDVVARLRWNGMEAAAAVDYAGAAAPALLGARPAVAYRSTKGTLALDLSGRLRNPVLDGGGALDRIGRSLGDVEIALPRIAVLGAEAVPVAARFTSRATGAASVVAATVLTDDGGARLRFADRVELPSGRYQLDLRMPESGRFIGARPCRVGRRLPGSVLEAVRRHPSPLRLARLLLRGATHLRA